MYILIFTDAASLDEIESGLSLGKRIIIDIVVIGNDLNFYCFIVC